MTKAILLASKNCPHCATAKAKLKKEIESGEIKVIELETDEETFRKIAKAFDIRGVPTILGIVDEGGKKKLCQIDPQEKNYGECKEVNGVSLE